MEDAAIVELYFDRDERAIIETQVKYGGYCRSIAFNLLANRRDSEECISDALHSVWESIPPERPKNLRCYVGRITRNIAVSRWRSEHAKKRSLPVGTVVEELNDCIPVCDPAESVTESDELAACLNTWLGGLTADERALFILRYWHGYGVAALAQRSGETPERVSQMLFRLKKRLKSYLTAKGVNL